ARARGWHRWSRVWTGRSARPPRAARTGSWGAWPWASSLGFAALSLHLNPAAELAERVLLPSNPHRALALAQHLLEAPRMFNHAHGLWGYTGVAADGRPLTIQSTGVGGPSAAIVSE